MQCAGSCSSCVIGFVLQRVSFSASAVSRAGVAADLTGMRQPCAAIFPRCAVTSRAPPPFSESDANEVESA
eukprot:4079643-Pleurochrysis_carterae.AAC.2